MEVLFIALGMWVTTVFLSSWMPRELKQRAVGAGAITDITIHIALQFLFGGTGAERVGLLMAGVMINVTMHLYKYAFGYITLTGKYHAGRFNKKSAPPENAKKSIWDDEDEDDEDEEYKYVFNPDGAA